MGPSAAIPHLLEVQHMRPSAAIPHTLEIQHSKILGSHASQSFALYIYKHIRGKSTCTEYGESGWDLGQYTTTMSPYNQKLRILYTVAIVLLLSFNKGYH